MVSTRCFAIVLLASIAQVGKSAQDSSTAFSVEAQGTGSFTGLAYEIPAHSTGKIEAAIQTLAITTANVDTLNKYIMGMLSASQRSKVEDYEHTHASADISIWSFFFGGGASASYDQTHKSMKSMGLTDQQITDIIEKFGEVASKMNSVKLDLEVDNRNYDYSVSGSLQLYTISGTVKTSKGQFQYRFLAKNGTAGNQAPASGGPHGGIIPLGSDLVTYSAPMPTLANADSGTGFSVDAQGTGSFTGLAYDIPAHSTGKIEAAIQTLAITSANVDTLNKYIMGMLSASQRSKVEDYEHTHASADISIWSLFGGGASASYDQTHKSMKSMGLTDEQITDIIEKFGEVASKMNTVKLDLEVDNRNYDYSVSGSLQLYTISGNVKTSKGQFQYRFLANKGTAGGQAPASGGPHGGVIPLGSSAVGVLVV